jgi:uncharacterized protein
VASLKEAAAEFLAQRRIAVCGVSRAGDVAANVVYRRLREDGYEVFAVNPGADEVEGDRCYRSLRDVPGGVDGVVIGTPPGATADVVRESAELGIPRVWVHRSFGTGSSSPEAVTVARDAGIELLDGGCPMMFLEPVDLGHRCMRWLLARMGRLPG